MNKKIRSEYIQNLVNEKDALKKKLEEMASETIKDVLSEEINKNLRKIIVESDEDDNKEYEEEEVDDTPVIPDEDGTEEGGEEPAQSEDDADAPEGDGEVEDIIDGEGADDEDGLWDDLEQYKDETGEYDLRGMDRDSVVKVLKLISTDENNGVRVYKGDAGNTIVLNDDETEKQYVIDLDGADGDADVEVTEEGCSNEGENVNEDLGYTTDYQDETAMTTPSNNEPAKSSETYSMDGGVPTGTEKPFGKGGQHSEPFEDNVNEENDFEIEVEDDEDDAVEEATNVGGFAVQNTTAKSHVPNSNGRAARNQSKGGECSGTTKPRYSNAQMESIMKKANAIFEENKQLKGIVAELKNQINEAIVINYNMGRVIKLVTENSTSKEEKLSIIKEFDKVRTLKEAKETFEKVNAELKDPNRIAKINNMLDKQLSESKTAKTSVVETQMYNSDDLNETISFMARLNAIK